MHRPTCHLEQHGCGGVNHQTGQVTVDVLGGGSRYSINDVGCTTCSGCYLHVVTQDVEDSEMEEDEESQADGFVVDDGYLSAGEGGPIDNDDFGAEVEGRHPHSRLLQSLQLHLTDLLDVQLPYMTVPVNALHDRDAQPQEVQPRIVASAET